MGTLTVTYAKGRFLLGANRISVEVDGVPEGYLEKDGSRTFLLPDGRHLIVFRYAYVKMKVDLCLSGDDSFTVSWDRAMGGMRVTKEFEGDVFFDRRAAAHLAAYVLVVAVAFAIYGLILSGNAPFEFGVITFIILMTLMMFLLYILLHQMSRTVVWGEEDG